MNSMRKFVFCLTAVMVATFVFSDVAVSAGPGPKKTYSLQLILSSANYDGSQQLVPPATMAVRITNESPPSTANSNIGSYFVTLYGLVMVPSPGDPNANPPIPPSPSCPGALCSIDATGSVLTVTNISPPIQAKGIYTVTFRVNSCGVGTVALPSTGLTKVFNGSNLSGQEFGSLNFNNTANLSCGILSCAEQFTVPVSGTSCSLDSTGLGCVSGLRGMNKDGFCTAADDVSYTATNTLSTSNLLHVEWATDPTAAFAYKLNAATGGEPNVSWLPPAGTPIFIQAPECRVLASNPPTDLPLPRRYGQLAGAVAANDKKITVTLDSGVLPPAEGEPINIGGERLVVTKVTNNQWTVDRRTAGTPVDPNVGTAYPAGQPVMFTGLPLVQAPLNCFDGGGNLLSSCPSNTYFVGMQAQMCRASAITDNGNGTFSYWVVDTGDGWVSPRN